MRTRTVSSLFLSVGVLALPLLTSAATLNDTIKFFNNILNALIALFILLAIVVFFWGLIQYLVNVGSEKSKGLQTMFYGVIAIFVMVSIWGIIALLQNTFGVGNGKALTPAGIQVNLPN